MAESVIPNLETIDYNLHHHCKDMHDNLQRRNGTNPTTMETKIIVSLINELLKMIKRGQLSDIPDNNDNYDIRFLLTQNLRQYFTKQNDDINRLQKEAQRKDDQIAALKQELQSTKQSLTKVSQEKTALETFVSNIQQNEKNMIDQNEVQFDGLQTKIRAYEDEIQKLHSEIRIYKDNVNRLEKTKWDLELQIKKIRRTDQQHMNEIFYEQNELFEKNENLLKQLQELQQNNNEQQQKVAEPQPQNVQQQIQEEAMRQEITGTINKMPLNLIFGLIGVGLLGLKFLND